MEHIIAYEGKGKVALGLMQEEYVPIFLPWINKRVGIEGTLLQPPYSYAGGIEWVRELEKSKGKEEVFAVLLRKPGNKTQNYHYVGHMGLHNIRWSSGFATAGSIIGPGHQGQGIGTEAMLLLLYHAFMVLGLRKVVGDVKAFNTSSMAHLVKTGYKIIGRYREHYFHEGAFIDEVIFEAFRKDWEPIWDQYQKTKKIPKLTAKQRTTISIETIARN